MNPSPYKFEQGPFGRWFIVKRDDPALAWSGSRWVLLWGNVQVCNFGTQDEARQYAKAHRERINRASPRVAEHF